MQIYGSTIRFGIHSGQQYDTFDQCLHLWQRAEEQRYDWVSIFDHFRPMDRPTGPCFEGTTLLSALAARTNHVRCAMLVIGVAYRHPAVVANIASTLDHISGGRLELGMGAGAFDLGQEQYGLPFPRDGIRLDMLDEACHIMHSLWSQETTTFQGKHYQLQDARLEPKPVQQRIPLVLGGSGEQKMLRLVAKHADIWNTMGGNLEAYQSKLEALTVHCAAVERDPDDIRKSILFRAVLAENEQEAQKRLDIMLGHPPPDSPQRRGWLSIGSPEQCVERLRPYVDLGVRDFLLGIRAPGDEQTMELFARYVAPALRA